tara:strand:- start:19552 stop:20061 length:510 start_codon:yes stop_codon:yes gene_type:complete
MKKFIFFISIFILSSNLFAQNITITQLTDLCDKGLGEVEEYLSANKWYFFQGVDETDEKYGNAKFVFDRPNYGPGVDAYYFITHYISENDKATATEILFRDKNLLDAFDLQIKNLKYKLKDSGTRDGSIIKVFQKGGKTIEVSIPPNFEGTNNYKLLFAKNKDYRKIRG